MSIPFSANQEVCNNRSGIYAIVNLKTEKFYIGSAVKLNSRKSLHLNQLRKGKHHSKYLQNSYNKHGEECFIFKVLEYVEDENNLLKIEQKYLDIYFHTGITYNISPIAGSPLGIKRSDETKKKISFAKQNMSDETKQKMSKPVVQLTKNNNFVERFNSLLEANAKTGVHKDSIGACCLGKQKSAGGYLWMYEKDYLNGKRPDKNNLIHGHSKPIIQFTKQNEFVKKYNSITEASRETEIKRGSISACCSGNLKSAGGYIWRYELS